MSVLLLFSEKESLNLNFIKFNQMSYALDPVTGVCMSVCVPIVLCLGLLMLLLSPNRRRQRRPGHNRADLDGEVRCVYVSMCVCKV